MSIKVQENKVMSSTRTLKHRNVVKVRGTSRNPTNAKTSEISSSDFERRLKNEDEFLAEQPKQDVILLLLAINHVNRRRYGLANVELRGHSLKFTVQRPLSTKS